MSIVASSWSYRGPARRGLFYAMGLLAIIALPLVGCDSTGVNEDDGTDSGTNDISAPEDVEAMVRDDGTVELAWSDVDAAASYSVYRSTSSIDNTDDSPLAREVTDTTYVDDATDPDTSYNYRLTSVGSDGTESDLSENAEANTPLPSPGTGGTDSWTQVRVSTDNDLNDVALTTDGAYAVADGGILLKRTDSTWTTIFNDGPASNGNNLLGVAATDDRERLWLVGASGAIGQYDVTTGTLTDVSAPNDVTNNFQAVAVAGTNIYIGDASGKVLYSTDRGDTWTQVQPAGNDSEISALDAYATSSAHLVTVNQTALETTDTGNSWSQVGIPDANASLYGVDSDATDDVWVAAGSGTVYHRTGSGWTANAEVGMNDLQDLEVADDDQSGYVVGGSATVFGYDGSQWTEQSTPGSSSLNAVVLGTDATPPIAVGDGGTVIER